ncbi:uncharacterized protein LOC113277788 [Papaver somniferum]|nr:uncharacterized protein LOC113277788 [Papaver somniferum]
MKKNDSSQSGDRSGITKSSIDYYAPNYTQNRYSDDKSSLSSGSTKFPSESSISNSGYRPPPSSSYNKEHIIQDSSHISSQGNAALRLVNKDLKTRLNLSTEVSVHHQKNHRSAYISSGFPNFSIINGFCTLSIEDNGGNITENINRVAPIYTQDYYSAASPNHKSSSSSDSTRFSSQNSSKLPSESSICDSVYRTSSSSSSNEEHVIQDSSQQVDILSQENGALLLVSTDLKNQLNLPTEVSVNHQNNHRRYGFPSLSIIHDFFRTISIGDNGGSTDGHTITKNDNRFVPSREARVTSPTSVLGHNNKGFDEKPVQVQTDRDIEFLCQGTSLFLHVLS